MRKSQISASMMCSNLVDLQATIDVFEKEKVEYLHIDVMDGEFVPNFGLGVDYIRGLRELTSIPLDRSEERRVGKECRSRWSPYH